MVDVAEIKRLLKIHFSLYGYTGEDISPEINADGSVVVHGSAYMTKSTLDGKIPVKFNIVDGMFGAPGAGLTSFENFPDVCSNIWIPRNRITSLKGCPSYLGELDVQENKLENFLGGPEIVEKILAYNNPLKSLVGLPTGEEPYTIGISFNRQLPLLRLLTADQIFIAKPGADANDFRAFEPVHSIMNKYAGEGKRALFDCQKDLEDAGFEENAKW